MGSISTLGNDGTGHDALCRMLKPLKVGLVVLETEVRQNGFKERVQLDDQSDSWIKWSTKSPGTPEASKSLAIASTDIALAS